MPMPLHTNVAFNRLSVAKDGFFVLRKSVISPLPLLYTCKQLFSVFLSDWNILTMHCSRDVVDLLQVKRIYDVTSMAANKVLIQAGNVFVE